MGELARRYSARRRIIFAVCLLPITPLFAQYAEILSLTLSDPVYRQHQSDLARFYQFAVTPKGELPLAFYQYRVAVDDDFLALAARFSLRPETLASLNGLDNPMSLVTGSTLLVPTIQAVFVADQPRTILEEVMAAWRDDRDQDAPATTAVPVVVRVVDERRAFLVYPNELFHPIERAYFYRRLFRLPVPEAVLSSAYGRRQSPFSGHSQFHGGVDLAAPAGASVLSAQRGEVISVLADDVLGKHIVVRHEGAFETLYGHLEETLVSVGAIVAASEQVGTVGATGLATGPHLHFEVRRDGERINPNDVLPQQISRDQASAVRIADG